MPRTMVEEFTSTAQGMAAYEQERAILEVTILIRRILKEENLTKSDLASRMRRSKSYVTQLLDGRANMTVRTIADVMTALGRSLHFAEGPLGVSVSPGVTDHTRPRALFTPRLNPVGPYFPDVIATMPDSIASSTKPYGMSLPYESPAEMDAPLRSGQRGVA
jgi:transcriptional regulator with XRE-family HTH domain